MGRVLLLFRPVESAEFAHHNHHTQRAAHGPEIMLDYEAVRDGLRNGEFFTEYLPVVALDSGRCVGGEALARWRRPSGVVQPGDFLSLIERTDLAGLLTYCVLERVAADFLDWLKDHDDVFLSINVPPEIIGRGGIAYVAEKTGLMEVMDKLVAEITERGVPDQIGVDALNRAAAAGVRIALDDVGTGGANLLVLARCNIEMIKLDRRLVTRICRNEPLPSNLEALAMMLKTRTMEVIAEGVETADQVEALKRAGVRLAQGFHFSRPLSAEDFKRFFAERNAP